MNDEYRVLSARIPQPPAQGPPSPSANLYSVVVPVYNSQDTLPELISRIDAFFAAANLRYEIILVNDASQDGSWPVLQSLLHGREDALAIDLTRNVGQHTAVLCGLRHAQGDFVVTIDDDLQNPPEEIRHLIDKANEGFDVVFARYGRKRHPLIRRIGSRAVGWLNTWLFGKPPGLTLSGFRILRRSVVRQLCRQRTRRPYLPAMLLSSGSRMANVSVRHEPRQTGRSQYNARRIAALLGSMLFCGSPVPIRAISAAGLLAAVAMFAAAVGSIAVTSLAGQRVPGWCIPLAVASIVQGYLALAVGVLGEHVLRFAGDLASPQPYHVGRTAGRPCPVRQRRATSSEVHRLEASRRSHR